MSAQSPSWKKPSKLLKVAKKRNNKSSGCRPRSAAKKEPEQDVVQEATTDAHPGPKRKNPFGCTAIKRSKIINSSQTGPSFDEPAGATVACRDSDNAENLFNMLHSTDCIRQIPSSMPLASVDSINIPSQCKSPSDEPEGERHNKGDFEEYCPTYPLDWSMKSKLRFFSDQPFHWCCPLKSSEEAKGVQMFVQNQGSQPSGPQPATIEVNSELKEALHSCCMYWMHPHLPWLNLYPRIVSDNKIGSVTCTSQDNTVLNALQRDWAESFTSLFHQLRVGVCPYFYVCTHQLSVLFRHSGSNNDIGALLTPSTRGFRQTIQKEGIDFQMPLNPKYSSQSQSSVSDGTDGSDIQTSVQRSSPSSANNGEDQSKVEEIKEDLPEDDETDESNSLWLEDLGLDKKKFRALDPERLKFTRENWGEIDQRAESVVVVDTPQDTIALFNLLLNSKSCYANSGVQTGIPPTLLSPAPFKGASLRTLQVRALTVTKGQSEGKKQQQYCLELSGPILPTSVSQLVQVLRKTHSSASLSFSTVDETTAFNATTCPLPAASLCHEENLGKKALRQMLWNAQGFSWAAY